MGRLQQWLLLVALSAVSTYGAAPCSPRSYGTGRIVCVCNATYCDTLDPVDDVPEGQYVLYSSTKAGLRFQKTTGQINSEIDSENVLVVNPNDRHQTIIGFGGSFTDAAGINILTLSSPAQDLLLRSYYSPEGLEFTMGRVPIAGSDFSTHPYTYDDVVNDTTLSEFKLTEEDNIYKLPIIKRAQEMSPSPIKLLSAAWTAPPWMKTNNDYTGFAFLKEQYYQIWAEYHLKFLDAYKAEGLTFWAMSTGNEPSNGIIPIMKFNSMGWTPQTQRKWVAENLGPVIRNSEHKDLKLLALDDQRFMLPWWINIMMEDENARKYIDGVAVHWYWDNLLPAALLTATHNNFPDKFIISTEACKGDRPWNYPKVYLGSWSRAEDYIADIIQDTNHWVAGWVDWNLALDLQGGPNWANNLVDAAIIVNKTADEFYKQPIYYAMGHVTKFVPEGSVHIAVEPSSQNGVYTSAFEKPNGEVVVIIHNRKSSDREVTLKAADKGYITLNIPKQSFNTLLF